MIQAPNVLTSLLLGAALAAQSTQPADPAQQARAMLALADEVQQQVEEIRGWRFTRPVRKDVRTEAQLREYLEQKLFTKEYPPERLAKLEAWLRALALLPPGAEFRKTLLDVLLNQVGGFYDPDEGAFYMMVEAARYGEFVNRMLIAHELCHALDDQHVDLRRLIGSEQSVNLSEDQSFALGGLVEGSATALMFAWTARHMATGKVDAKEMAAMQRSELERMKPFLEAPPYFTLLAANYMVGLHFVTRGKGALGVMAPNSGESGQAIREAVKSPPRSSEQILHPDKYWNREERDEPVLLEAEDELARQIEAWSKGQVVHRNTLGELLCALMAAPKQRRLNVVAMNQASYWTNRHARGWGGDRLFLLADAEGGLAEPAVLWVTAWDRVEDCEEFLEGVRKHRGEAPGFAVAAEGRVAVLGFGTRARDEALLTRVLATARFVQDGKPWAKGP